MKKTRDFILFLLLMDYTQYMVELAFVRGIGDESFHVSRNRIGARKLKEIATDVAIGSELGEEADLSDPSMTLPRMAALYRIGLEEKSNIETTMLLLVTEIVNLSLKGKKTAQDTSKKYPTFSESLKQAFKDFVSMERSYLMLKQIIVRCEQKMNYIETQEALSNGQDVEPFVEGWIDLEYPVYKYIIYEALGKCPPLDVGIRRQDYSASGYAKKLIERSEPLFEMGLYDFSLFEFLSIFRKGYINITLTGQQSIEIDN
jgi:hypothetical protein